MSESFGARLRHQREQQGVSLRAIADQTKINGSLLEALERDDVSRWPTGIFRRAYLRSYASAIGLDADETLREFLALYPDPAGPALEPAVNREPPLPGAAPPTRIGMILHHIRQAVFGRAHVPQSAPPAESPPQAPSPPPAAPDDQHVLAGAVDVGDRRPTDATTQEADRSAAEPAAAASGTGPLEPELTAVARLCTEIGRADDTEQVQPLLGRVAQLLDANGLIVWLWDRTPALLRPALAHGYSRRVLATLPPVQRDADNPTAAAFRSESLVAVSDESHGALVVPLLASTGCVGVLALEVPRGREHESPVQALATIVAALLVPLTGAPRAASRPAAPPRHQSSRPPVRRRRSAAFR